MPKHRPNQLTWFMGQLELVFFCRYHNQRNKVKVNLHHRFNTKAHVSCASLTKYTPANGVEDHRQIIWPSLYICHPLPSLPAGRTFILLFLSLSFRKEIPYLSEKKYQNNYLSNTVYFRYYLYVIDYTKQYILQTSTSPLTSRWFKRLYEWQQRNKPKFQ